MSVGLPFPRRRSLRLPTYDYSHPGAYFVTICTFDRKNLCGQIDDAIQPSIYGDLAEQAWHDLPMRWPQLLLDAFVVMPNHIHGIMHFQNSTNTDQPKKVDPNAAAGESECAQEKSSGLGSIVRAHKSRVFNLCFAAARNAGSTLPKLWQRNCVGSGSCEMSGNPIVFESISAIIRQIGNGTRSTRTPSDIWFANLAASHRHSE